MGRVSYTTRESVQDAFDIREAAHRSTQIDEAIASASDDIDGWLNRHKHGLAPRIATRYFNYPRSDFSRAWRLWLDENELISVTTLTAGGTVIASTDYFSSADLPAGGCHRGEKGSQERIPQGRSI